VTVELVRRLRSKVMDLGVRALSGDEVTFEERKGEVKALKWVLTQMDDITTSAPEEDEENV
jgi:hypothetical protein